MNYEKVKEQRYMNFTQALVNNPKLAKKNVNI